MFALYYFQHAFFDHDSEHRTPPLHRLRVYIFSRTRETSVQTRLSQTTQLSISIPFLCVHLKNSSYYMAIKLFESLYVYLIFFFNWIVPMENSGCLLRRKPAAIESRYPTYGAYWVFPCFHSPPNSDMNDGIFNVCTDVNACNCARGWCENRKRVYAASWLWEKNPLPHRGIEPASAVCRSDALPTEPHPHP